MIFFNILLEEKVWVKMAPRLAKLLSGENPEPISGTTAAPLGGHVIY